MTSRLILRLLGDLWHRFGWRCPTLVALIVAAGLLEGLAISLLLPLLSVLRISGSEESNQVFSSVFHLLGLKVTFASVASLMGALVLLQSAAVLGHSRLSSMVQSKYLRVTRQEIFSHIMQADWPFLMNRSAGALINSVTIEPIHAASAVNTIVQLTSALAAAAIFVGIAVALSWQLTLILLLCAGLIATLLHPILHQSQVLGRELSSERSHVFGWLNEVFNGVKLIKATAAEERVAERFERLEEKLERINRRVHFQPYLLRVVFEASGLLLLLLLLALATAILSIGGGIVITIVVLFIRLYPRLGNVQQLFQQLLLNLPAVEKLDALNEELARVKEHTERKRTPLSAGDIDIVDLHLNYDNRPILRGINLRLAVGRHYAFVGPSGAGKTSLVDCLLGLVHYTKGEIRVGQVPIKEVGLANWRSSVGYVTQETILFNMSIRDNIAWSNVNASQEEIESAARRANAHDFIVNTAKGYDTVIGDRGLTLSGGQRQRIGLARALLGDRVLLVLDEATSALDTDAEESILEAICDLRGRMTVVVIAHRLSTVRFCDQIVLLDQGSVVESGGWSELMTNNGRFASLVQAQGVV